MNQATGLKAIAAERVRQIDEECFLPEQDDELRNGELAQAAAAYAYPEGDGVSVFFQDLRGGLLFPAAFAASWWKPGQGGYPRSRMRELEKAGALIAAEWDRLARLEENLATFDGQNASTLSWTDWYGRLMEYSFILGHGREFVSDCGEECWKELYDDGLSVPEAFQAGFEE
jgi:hypothetical protein